MLVKVQEDNTLLTAKVKEVSGIIGKLGVSVSKMQQRGFSKEYSHNFRLGYSVARICENCISGTP